MAKVDVAIMRVPGEREDWFQYCLESLEREPVNVHIVEGVVGHIGKGRIKCLQVGSEPYVALVDPDDLVCRGAFDKCLDALEQNPQRAVAYTCEAKISPGGVLMCEYGKGDYAPFFGKREEALRAHHLTVYRRAQLPNLDFLDEYPSFPEQALKWAMWKDNFIFVDVVGYQWRQYADSASRKVWGNRTAAMDDIAKRSRSLWRFLV